ncbi:MAG: putative phage abortive infection protein [Hyphomonadaceae bacterium]|nr:putative phage abortive infection protein [Hyphomonadaceae bacterium]
MKNHIWIAIIASVFVAAVLIVTGLALHSDPHRGTFGDMFGFANALFSGVVFIGVTYAIFLQREEIRIARDDIRYTKTILDEQQKHLALQNEETKRQMFENTFFGMLTLLTEITSQIDVLSPEGRLTKGKDMFPIFIKRLRGASSGEPPIRDLAGFERIYKKFYAAEGKEVGHYYRVLYNIVKFIDKSGPAEKKFYSNILRAQLSDAEAALLFHKGLSSFGREKLKPLIEKYALLKNVKDEDLLAANLKDHYARSAYG